MINYDKLTEFSKSELIKLLKKQQQTIEIMQAQISRNEMLPPKIGSPAETHVRQALRRLDDVSALNHCSLLSALSACRQQMINGMQLQQMLTRVIAGLKPVNPRRNPQRKRQYDILRLAYLDKKKPAAIAKKLALSERQYYRELKGAIQLMTDQLSNLPE